jgi:energy-coupling factor transport system substrate-specific component
MLAAGWMGMGAAWLPAERGRSLSLVLYGAVWGLVYGAVTNLQYWPYALSSPDLSWAPGLGPLTVLTRYARFYMVTSLAWDGLRAAGNVGLILLLSQPLIQTLQRFQRRARVIWEPA